MDALREREDGEMRRLYREVPFADVAQLSDGRVALDMKYLAAGRPGAIDTAYLRRGAAELLLRAAEHLPAGYRFLIYDAWRPYSVQKSLYDEYYATLAEMPAHRGKREEELHALARTFVSFPDKSLAVSYVHSSGGAVDLTLLDPAGRELDMGCGFDEFTPLAATFAEGLSPLQAQNRALLYRAMTAVGFTNYAYEWWHYDYGDVFWARETGEEVLYPSVYDIREVTG